MDQVEKKELIDTTKVRPKKRVPEISREKLEETGFLKTLLYSSERSRERKESILFSTVDQFLNWSRITSLWPVTSGLACCAIEMMAVSMAHFDIARFGMEVFRASPRQADLLFVAGTVTKRMAPRVKMLYEQMPEPKWVIAVGSCATSGGPYHESYCVLDGVDKIIPVDVYIPGCPPRPEAWLYGIIQLREKIKKEGYGAKWGMDK